MTIVETTSGRVRGEREGPVLRFQAIPYGAPPIGGLRFRHPTAVEGWAGVRNATSRGPASLQAGTTDKPVRGEEDCLYLNVCTPDVAGPPRPTMVWFHGGGFTSGAGWLAEHDAAHLVARGDVVVVSCNYRLGALGWMYLADLDADFAPHGNPGLFDQLAVLRWVRDNIQRFGGDPVRVTAFGQSAGATGILTLATLPEARGLFHRAIAQSAAMSAVLSADTAREMTQFVLESLGARDVGQLLAASSEQILEAQRTAVLRSTTGAAARLGRQRLAPFGPVIDDVTITRPPLDALRSGAAEGLPLIAGANRDEWRYFATFNQSVVDESELLQRLRAWLPKPDRLWAMYRARTDTVDDAWIDLQTDRLFRMPVMDLVEAWGGGSVDTTYHYDFRWRPPGSAAGASHSREIPFVFDTFHHARGQMVGGAAPARSLIDFMQASWIEFARSGSPTDATWPAYGSSRLSMLLDAEISLATDLDGDLRRAWADVL
jgi:para-nitrobenzyl esterase